jgi:hypothetical protein
MQIGDRVSIKRKELTFHGQEPVIQDSPVLATVTSVHAPFSFTVKYDQPQDGYDYRELPFQAIPETVQIVSEIRDTQFAGFAELLWKDISSSLNLISLEYSPKQSVDEYIEESITRRAYDLVFHAADALNKLRALDASYKDEVGVTIPAIIQRIPDMTEWPEVSHG